MVAAQAWAGKEFLDMRQNERIEFTRVGDAFRTVGWLKGEPTLLWACSQFLYLQDKENSFGDGWLGRLSPPCLIW